MRSRIATACIGLMALGFTFGAARAETNEVTTTTSTRLSAIVSSTSSSGAPVRLSVEVDIDESHGVSGSTDGTAGGVERRTEIARIGSLDGTTEPCVTSGDDVVVTVTENDNIRASSTACSFDLLWRLSGNYTPDGGAAPVASPGDQSIDVIADAGVSERAILSGSIGGIPVALEDVEAASVRRSCCRGHVTLMK